MLLKENSYLSLEITSHTWLKKTDDLFDFESENISTKNYSFTQDDKENFIISYKENEFDENNDIISSRNLKDKLFINNTTKVISTLIYNNTSLNFSIVNSYKSKKIDYLFKPNHCERIWSIIPKNDYSSIKEGDVIKLGRLRLKFDKIIFNKKEKENNPFTDSNHINAILTTSVNIKDNNDDFTLTQKINNDNNNNNISEDLNNMLINKNNCFLDEINTKKSDLSEKICCKLCYQEESSILDPLLCPCKCSGSMKYIHYSCLKKSIKQKIQIRREDNCDLYFFKSYCCEICLETYPKYIKYKSNIYNLVDIDLSKYKEYILTSILYYSDNNNSEKKKLSYLGYLIFKIDEQNELKIGRNQNNHIVLKDISISRNHCILKRDNNILKIKDVKSKFGTLLYVRNIKKIEINKPLQLISGKHQFLFNLKIQKRMFSFLRNCFNQNCCSCNSNLNDKGEFLMSYKSENENNKIKELKSNNSSNDLFLEDKLNDYYKRFKDSDSYNDYIINMDYIIGVKDSFFNKYYFK